MKTHTWIHCAFLWIMMIGCSAKNDSAVTELAIASWNVQALFDGTESGQEYDEYRDGWTAEKYRARLNMIAGAFQSRDKEGGNGFDPDILALIEIENAGVLGDMAAAINANYQWTFFAGTPEGPVELEDGQIFHGSPLGMGILSRFPLSETKVHSIYIDGISIPRPVAEIWVEIPEPLALFVCHWKSKLGGEEETEALRRAGAGIIARRLQEISASAPETPVIVLGDLNENYDEFLRIGGAYPCALLPDSEEAAVMLRERKDRDTMRGFQDFLVISAKMPPPGFLEGVAASSVLYSPWADSDCEGSYYYQDNWETIDHFLLNAALFDKKLWEYKTFLTAKDSPFCNAAGRPAAYNPRTGNGLSDHFPVMLTLQKAGL